MVLRICRKHAEQEQEVDDEIDGLSFDFTAGPGYYGGHRPQQPCEDGGRATHPNKRVPMHRVVSPCRELHSSCASDGLRGLAVALTLALPSAVALRISSRIFVGRKVSGRRTDSCHRAYRRVGW